MSTEFDYRQRKYTCSLSSTSTGVELRIQNPEGKVLAVQKGCKSGLLGLSRATSEAVDVSKPPFYNLIRLALQAIDSQALHQRLLEQDQMMTDKDQIIHEKTAQILLLEQQSELLREELDQLSTEQQSRLQELKIALQQKEEVIVEREARIDKLKSHSSSTAPSIDPAAVEKKLTQVFGLDLWQALENSSQNDLISAFINYKTTQHIGFADDYSEAGVRLGFVIETEIVSRFFKELYSFMIRKPRYASIDRIEIAGVRLGPRQEQTIGKLPRLLAGRWQTFNRRSLDQAVAPAEIQLYRPWQQDGISPEDRRLIAQFLQHWSHPLSAWLQNGEQAASALDQVRTLRNRASHPTPLYEWQFRLLWSMVTGDNNCHGGILHQIYGEP